MTEDFVFSGSARQSGAGPIVRRDLPQEIVSRLRQDIISGEWSPGTRITEQMLSARFGVSRTPLREALKIVAAEGLLVLLPNRGAVVTQPTLEEAQEKMLVLSALEGLACQLACESATDGELQELQKLHAKMVQAFEKRQTKRYFELNDTFHRAVVIAARNPTLADFHAIASRHVKQARLVEEFRDHLQESSTGEHERIIDALLRRDGKAAKGAIEEHMATVRANMGRGVAAPAPATPKPATAPGAKARLPRRG